MAREQLTDIVELQLARLRDRLAERQLSLEVTEEAKEILAEEGWDSAYGARPLKRARSSASSRTRWRCVWSTASSQKETSYAWMPRMANSISSEPRPLPRRRRSREWGSA